MDKNWVWQRTRRVPRLCSLTERTPQEGMKLLFVTMETSLYAQHPLHNDCGTDVVRRHFKGRHRTPGSLSRQRVCPQQGRLFLLYGAGFVAHLACAFRCRTTCLHRTRRTGGRLSDRGIARRIFRFAASRGYTSKAKANEHACEEEILTTVCNPV